VVPKKAKKKAEQCPTCGHCPTCGRAGQVVAPYVPYTPYWPNHPIITWTSSDAKVVGTYTETAPVVVNISGVVGEADEVGRKISAAVEAGLKAGTGSTRFE
jgi:hypothetical protein